MKKKICLKDIAHEAGVSTALVSYVLNNKKEGRINKDLASKIREIAVHLNYRTNQIARSLKTNRTFTIGLIVADISNNFSSSLARIIEDEADHHGYTVLFGSSDENEHKFSKILDTLINRQVDGLIMAPPENVEPQILMLEQQQIPFVFLWPEMNSSNTTTREHVTPFAHQVFEDLRHRYRSLVLVFGTNTGADFGSALAMTQGQGLEIPIIIASGQRHHGRMGSDSMDNIETSVRAAHAAAEAGIAEVMVYSGKAGSEVLRAVTSVKRSDKEFLIYESPSTAPLGVVEAHDVMYKPHARRVDPSIEPELFPNFEGKVAVLSLHMDMDASIVTDLAKKEKEDNGCDVIILDSYETGNVPDRFLPVIEKAVENGTKIIVVPYFSEPSLSNRIPKEEQNAVNAGAITAPGNVTRQALTAKITHLIAHSELVDRDGGGDFEEALNRDKVGEMPR